ncbi:hypothetical protein [Amycolatopsis sp. NPDC059657]|uniref:hypothetical protein n=1 Tax=Amycolatopsis sp. NPDC059657 TaxID=3346899 RepID=UPI0036712CAC
MTARIYERLVTEHGFTAAGQTVVYEYVARRQPELVAELREEQRHLQGMVPQQHQPGEEAEVDFADVRVWIAGTVMNCPLFTRRLSFSGRSVIGCSCPKGRRPVSRRIPELGQVPFPLV